jgi:hypothetical protein
MYQGSRRCMRGSNRPSGREPFEREVTGSNGKCVSGLHDGRYPRQVSRRARVQVGRIQMTVHNVRLPLTKPRTKLVDHAPIERILVSGQRLHHFQELNGHAKCDQPLRERASARAHHIYTSSETRQPLDKVHQVVFRATDSHVAYHLHD